MTFFPEKNCFQIVCMNIISEFVKMPSHKFYSKYSDSWTLGKIWKKKCVLKNAGHPRACGNFILRNIRTSLCVLHSFSPRLQVIIDYLLYTFRVVKFYNYVPQATYISLFLKPLFLVLGIKCTVRHMLYQWDISPNLSIIFIFNFKRR